MADPGTSDRALLPVCPSLAASAGNVVAGSIARLQSQALFAGAQEVEIEHNGAVYRLRQTSLGKLLLTK